MNDIAINVENLSKRYRIGLKEEIKDTLFGSMTSWIKSPISNFSNLRKLSHFENKSTEDTIWALKDINFNVKRGEVIGIIGRNGAGKSTLLKILSQITEPTTGKITLNGRVASLLEVGTGFHAELTGRENVYLNGTILGMTKKEVDLKFDEIVDFSGVEKFIDTPVKRYSSGMKVRLAFAVAAHLEPEILLIDEVLAVGDASFQKKCLGKMEDISKEGRTVIFVSHDMNAVSRLCRKTILLENGEKIKEGSTPDIMHAYLKDNLGTSSKKCWNTNNSPGNSTVKLSEVFVHDINYNINYNFDITKPLGITIIYDVLKADYILTPTLNFHNERSINIFDTHDTTREGQKTPKNKGRFSSTVWIPGNYFAEGVLSVGVGIITPDPFFVHLHIKDLISFNIVDYLNTESARGYYVGHFPGLIRPLLKWETKSTLQYSEI